MSFMQASVRTRTAALSLTAAVPPPPLRDCTLHRFTAAPLHRCPGFHKTQIGNVANVLPDIFFFVGLLVYCLCLFVALLWMGIRVTTQIKSASKDKNSPNAAVDKV